MTIPDIVEPEENLGRGIFSSRHRRGGKVRYYVFLAKDGEVEISVDRLNHMPEEEAVRVALKVAAARSHAEGQRRNFYGWAVLAASLACKNGRQVVSSPQLGNRYHADIILPALAADEQDEQKQHAQELADYSELREFNS